MLAQTRARVLRGDTHYPGKVVSLFEPHTEIIRKGKLATPTEFGRLVKIQKDEAQLITDYAVCERRQSERALWEPALDRHIALFDCAPTAASPRARMNALHRTAGSGTSCCRGSPARSALSSSAWCVLRVERPDGSRFVDARHLISEARGIASSIPQRIRRGLD